MTVILLWGSFSKKYLMLVTPGHTSLFGDIGPSIDLELLLGGHIYQGYILGMSLTVITVELIPAMSLTVLLNF